MAVHPLENARWGFESNCFVCEQHNERGMQLPFFHDDERDVVFADYTLGDEFSGAPTYVHGGVTLAVLDEAMAWAAIAVGEKFAVTHETSATFDYPVRVGRAYRVEASLTERSDERFKAEARVLDAKGRPCVRATSSLVVLSPAKALDALGTEASGDNARYVR
ncbi:MAG TPA: PaaI family thioesterase [Acidimicrobiia bacterium]|jgi:acyl-coenzyme A thioesterase PaaI-like protein|nr:PaaI family thioesterase [Acidimicrobiia bacterium]